MTRRIGILLVLTAVAGFGWTARSRAATATDDLCGATIVDDLHLDHDLTCPGAGLIIGADDIKIHLEGHTIAGPGTGVGIRVAGRSGVTVQGGFIRNFETGIMVANSSDVTVKDNDVTQTREGIFLNGTTDSVVKNNRSFQNQIRGVMIRPSNTRISTGNLVVDNILTDNPVGILIFGQPGNGIRDNVISGSTTAGILLTGAGASGNVFRENAISNSAVGIQFGPAWTGNLFTETRLTFNTCGLQGTTTGNEFRETVFANNTADTCQ